MSSRRRSLTRRFVEGYLAAVKRQNDVVWRVPGGDNPIMPDVPTVPPPPGPPLRPRHPNRVKPQTRRDYLVAITIIVGLMVMAYLYLVLAHIGATI